MNRAFITNMDSHLGGELRGKWIGLPCNGKKFVQALHDIGTSAKYPEYFITDYDSDELPLYALFGEYANIEQVNQFIESVQGYEKEVAAIEEAYTSNPSEILEIIESGDYQFYPDMTMLDVAYELVDECYDLDKLMGGLAYYFDYEKYARDLSFDSYYETSEGVIYIG